MTRMNAGLRRSLAAALEVAGAVVVIASTIIVDVPGPMMASKPEFIFKFSPPFAALAVTLAIAGVALLARDWRRSEPRPPRRRTLGLHWTAR